ncbi:MAG TPA: arginine decarboxylase, pyruvoyl-dependent [Thermaerobacter sp.]
MLPTPTRFALVTGRAEGQTPLTAFDAALLAAGVANVNLVRVSSILPPGARPLERLVLPPGALVPIAYGKLVAVQPGQRIAAAVAVGRGRDDEFGMILEHTAYGTAGEVEATIRRMVDESFTIRGGRPREILVRAVDHVVEHCGCVFAGCVLWYD